MRFDPSVFHSDSFAKYAVAFFVSLAQFGLAKLLATAAGSRLATPQLWRSLDKPRVLEHTFMPLVASCLVLH